MVLAFAGVRRRWFRKLAEELRGNRSRSEGPRVRSSEREEEEERVGYG
jgi:hypothetical protein